MFFASEYIIHNSLAFCKCFFYNIDMAKLKQHTKCPIDYGLMNFGDKWSLIIVRDIMFGGKKYYGDFAKSAEGISTNILASRLSSLEANGILNKDQDLDNKTKYIYSLTEKGKDLLPIMVEIVSWGDKYDSDTEIDKDFRERMKNDKEGFLKDLRNMIGTKLFD